MKDCSKKKNSMVSILVYTLQCKACEKTDPTCLLGHDTPMETCSNDDDLCYSWFERSSKFALIVQGHFTSILFIQGDVLVSNVRVCLHIRMNITRLTNSYAEKTMTVSNE